MPVPLHAEHLLRFRVPSALHPLPPQVSQSVDPLHALHVAISRLLIECVHSITRNLVCLDLTTHGGTCKEPEAVQRIRPGRCGAYQDALASIGRFHGAPVVALELAVGSSDGDDEGSRLLAGSVPPSGHAAVS